MTYMSCDTIGRMTIDIIETDTPRLRLRQWRDSDLAPFFELAGDPLVMEFLLPLPTRADSDAAVARTRSRIDENGWGFWAVEHRESGEFMGFTGLNSPMAELPFSPCVEIGWRLDKTFWGNGYATEGARLVLAYAIGTLALAEVVSFTAHANWRSRRVMQRLRMTHRPEDDFDHPKIAEGHPLRRHVLYRARCGDLK